MTHCVFVLMATWHPPSRVALQSVADLKARLFRASAGVNRGLSCREGEKEEIEGIVEELEVGNHEFYIVLLVQDLFFLVSGIIQNIRLLYISIAAFASLVFLSSSTAMVTLWKHTPTAVPRRRSSQKEL